MKNNSIKKNLFAESLADSKEFTLTYELVPGQGAGGKKIDRLLEFARQAKIDGRITALSVTDNAGGHPALAPVAIGSEIQKIGLEPLIHFSLKDKNRNQIESHLFLYQRQQFRNLLILGGDFPKNTYFGQAKPVYDLDSIQTIQLVERMKAGDYRYLQKDNTLVPPFDLQCGCVVSPFKKTEAEQVWQYAKLLKKIRAGAHFIITQLGYDLKKYEELILFLKKQRIRIPVLANVFIPSPGVAKFMANGGVPGVMLAPELAETMQREGKEKRLLRAAGMTAALRHLGFAGIHLGGNGLSFNDVDFVLDQAQQFFELGTFDWKNLHFPIAGCWYLYQNDGTNQPLNPGTQPGSKPLHHIAHQLFFSKTSPLSRVFARFCIFCDSSAAARKLLVFGERVIKEILFNCRMCGDCTLSESTYLCPQSGCPKKLINGPCGGSSGGACEVFPERLCFFVRVYQRLDRKTTLTGLADTPILPPKDWSLERASSWINYFKGNDHTGHSKGKERKKKVE